MLGNFDYYRPNSVDEACDLLSRMDEAAVLAGGTDLLVEMRDGKHRPRAVVDIKGVDELRGVEVAGDRLVVKALVTVTELLNFLAERSIDGLALLGQAGAVFGCFEIRNRATVCGNIAHASPGSEFGSPMFVLGADVLVRGPGGNRRSVPVGDFVTGPGRNALEKGELVEALSVPLPPRGSRSWYRRISRVRGMDLAGMNVALLVTDPDDANGRKIRIALGAVHRVPLRPVEAEEALSGRPLDAERVAAVCAGIVAGLEPRASSLRAGPAYKKAMVARLLEEGIRTLVGWDAGNGEGAGGSGSVGGAGDSEDAEGAGGGEVVR